MPQIRIAAMFHQSTTAEGKLYIAALDPKAHFAIYGPNRASGGGTKADKPTLQEMEKTVRTKQKEGYTLVDPQTLSVASRNSFVAALLQSLGFPAGTSVQWNQRGDSIEVDGAVTAQPPKGPKAKPVVWNKGEVDVWI